MPSKRTVGIDLGTTNSVLAVYDEEQGRAVVVPNSEGELFTPSAVAIIKGEMVVGSAARRMAAAYPDETALGFKRGMGVTTPDGLPIDYLTIREKTYPPETLSAAVLHKLCSDASERLGWEITRALVTTPAYFDDSGRRATRNAGRIAGLEVPRIINEPTAGALVYGVDSAFTGRVAVYDFGGGTFDISILEVEGGHYTVRATDGDRQLGGDDLTNVIVVSGLEAFEKKGRFRPTPEDDPTTLLDLFDKAERAKLDLTARSSTAFCVSGRGCEVRMEITRDEFEDKIRPMVERTLEITERTIEAADVAVDELTLILVGGSTRIPLVQALISERLGIEPMKANVEEDLAVAKGAAIAAAATDKIVEGEAVGGLADLVFKDVVAHALGVEIVDPETGQKVFSPIIPENSRVPVEAEAPYALEMDIQTTARIRVFEGSANMPTDSPEVNFVGEVVLRGIPINLPRTKRIKVRFGFDRDSVVVVDAVDEISGKSTHGRLEHQGGLTEQQIEEARQEIEGGLTT